MWRFIGAKKFQVDLENYSRMIAQAGRCKYIRDTVWISR